MVLSDSQKQKSTTQDTTEGYTIVPYTEDIRKHSQNRVKISFNLSIVIIQNCLEYEQRLGHEL